MLLLHTGCCWHSQINWCWVKLQSAARRLTVTAECVASHCASVAAAYPLNCQNLVLLVLLLLVYVCRTT